MGSGISLRQSWFGTNMQSAQHWFRFVEKHGVVLESARGPVPSLAEAIAGEPIRGSWWGHQKSHEIFRITRAIRACEDILVCRLLDDKVTFVHRRLWPALVRLAGEIPRSRLAQIAEVHTESGRHHVVETALEDWLPANIKAAARSLPRGEATAMLPASIFAATGTPELGP